MEESSATQAGIQADTQPAAPAAGQPATVTVDGVKYDFASLSAQARATLASLAAVEGEMRRLQVQVDIARVAQQALGAQLRSQLPAKAA